MFFFKFFPGDDLLHLSCAVPKLTLRLGFSFLFASPGILKLISFTGSLDQT